MWDFFHIHFLLDDDGHVGGWVGRHSNSTLTTHDHTHSPYLCNICTKFPIKKITHKKNIPTTTRTKSTTYIPTNFFPPPFPPFFFPFLVQKQMDRILHTHISKIKIKIIIIKKRFNEKHYSNRLYKSVN